ncbi:hypothetical protein CMO88_01415 [Candidatus Woesearchaeota archaeon]|nr:hypothetical protein [Candidatus Woesearchaeota archaeon]|tara:strand:- start:32242 stop:32508 length:267 start_codon:yes stop_codon:yes gene_type:complete
MTKKVTKSEYIQISKSLIIKLYKLGCWGKGSLYEDELKDGFPSDDKGKVLVVADALVKQKILCKKAKKYGFKYYLNQERRDKIDEIRN